MQKQEPGYVVHIASKHYRNKNKEDISGVCQVGRFGGGGGTWSSSQRKI